MNSLSLDYVLTQLVNGTHPYDKKVTKFISMVNSHRVHATTINPRSSISLSSLSRLYYGKVLNWFNDRTNAVFGKELRDLQL